MWEWHIPLLFFLSGCVECHRYERKIGLKIISDIKTIVVPFFTFGLIALVFAGLYGDFSHNVMLAMLKDLLMGVRRNTFFVTQIWFLSCLVVMKLMFYLISLLQKKSLTVVLGIIIWFLGNHLVFDDTTHIFWNIDSAFHYYFYYICGFAIFPLLQKLLSEEKLCIYKWCVLVLLGAYVVAVYYYLIQIYDYNNYLFFVLILGIILFQCCFASLFVNVSSIKKLGQQTLYLCGNEGLMNYSISVISEMIGLNWIITKPISICIKALLTLVIISRFIYPWEKRLIDKITGLIWKEEI